MLSEPLKQLRTVSNAEWRLTMVCNRQRGFAHYKLHCILADIWFISSISGKSKPFTGWGITLQHVLKLVQFIMICSENQRHDLFLIMNPKDPIRVLALNPRFQLYVWWELWKCKNQSGQGAMVNYHLTWSTMGKKMHVCLMFLCMWGSHITWGLTNNEILHYLKTNKYWLIYKIVIFSFFFFCTCSLNFSYYIWIIKGKMSHTYLFSHLVR